MLFQMLSCYKNKGILDNCLSGCLLSMLFVGSEPKPLKSKGKTPVSESGVSEYSPSCTIFHYFEYLEKHTMLNHVYQN